MTPRLLTTTEAAAYLGFDPGTLENWRYKQRGPRWVRIGRTIRYDQADLDAWIAEQKGAA